MKLTLDWIEISLSYSGDNSGIGSFSGIYSGVWCCNWVLSWTIAPDWLEMIYPNWLPDWLYRLLQRSDRA